MAPIILLCNSTLNSVAPAPNSSSAGFVCTHKNDNTYKTTMKAHPWKETFGVAPPLAAVTRTKKPHALIKEKLAPDESTLSQRRTEVTASIDVGLGNTVFIRGLGSGLSWDKGTPLRCVGASTWVWSTLCASEKLIFKLLLNDKVWARGEDIVIDAGNQVQVVPEF